MMLEVKLKKVLIDDIDVEELLIKIGDLIDAKIEKFHLPETKEKATYLTRSEVASMLKIALPTLDDWTKLGWLTSYKMGNRVYYRLNEVEASMERLARNKYKKYIN